MKNTKLKLIVKIGILISFLCSLNWNMTIFAEEQVTNYNDYYRYPFSFGVKYQNLIPLGDFVEDYGFLFFDVSGTMEMPLSFLPRLKPLAEAGIMIATGKNHDTTSIYEDNKYNHTSLYTGIGIGYSYRFSKLLETGMEITGGIDYSTFPNLHPDNQTRGAYFIYADCTLPVTISPFYNLSIDIEPGLRFRKSTSPLDYFDGFLFSIGGTINFRLGEDPDITHLIRSIQLTNITIPPLFAGMQSYYRKNPVGSVGITNTEKYTVTNVKVMFYQDGYMDSPTPAVSLDELQPGETREIPLYASFNAEIFNTEGITPLTGKVMITYTSKGKPGEQTESVLYDLYDKTSLTWDDDAKLGAYITPADSVIKDYISFIKQAARDTIRTAYNNPLQTAMLFYSALTETGCIYQADPVLPFVSVQKNTALVDTINLSRDTLKRVSGDCDDLTVLFASMLESAGIESGFITLPGHVYPIFNTGISARNYRTFHPRRSMTINLNGTLWIPVEVTLIGKGDFIEAWEAGAREWAAWEETPEKRKVYITRETQTTYRPVGLKKADIDFPLGNKKTIAMDFEKDLMNLADIVIDDYRKKAHESGSESDYNKLGITYACFHLPEKAEESFQKALEIHPGYSLAVINLGNLFYQTQRPRDALNQYSMALRTLKEQKKTTNPGYLKLLLKLSVVYYELKEYDNAREYFASARQIAPEDAALYSYVTIDTETDTRSSELPGRALLLEYLDQEDL